jgi:hypothetical protein
LAKIGVDKSDKRAYTINIIKERTMNQYSEMSDLELVQTYNAVMANAYPGDEVAIENEMEKRGLDVDAFDDPHYPYPG